MVFGENSEGAVAIIAVAELQVVNNLVELMTSFNHCAPATNFQTQKVDMQMPKRGRVVEDLSIALQLILIADYLFGSCLHTLQQTNVPSSKVSKAVQILV